MDFWGFAGVERRRIYDIVNVLESVGVRDSLNFFKLKFHLLSCSYLNFAILKLLCFYGSNFLGSCKKGQESIYLERLWCNPDSLKGTQGLFICLLLFLSKI